MATAILERQTHDLVVVGAGPAGMAAAVTAAGLSLRVALVDEQPALGGQIYRAAGASPLAHPEVLGPDYRRGETLTRALATAPDIDHRRGATVWQVTRDHEVGLAYDGRMAVLRAPQIILATGAMERPCPFPGWTLPGVMTAGAGQVLLKSSGLVPADPVVIAGSGPLLFLVAWQYVNAGVPVAAVVETTPRANYRTALRHLPRALRAWEYLRKGLAMIRALKRAGVPLIVNAADLRAEAGEDGRVARLSFSVGGHPKTIDCGLLLVHQGVVPNVQITRTLDCTHDWDEAQRCWRPRLDAWGGTDADGILVAGDGAGIGGARVAEHQGRLAALEAAHRLGRLSAAERDARAVPERAGIAHHLAVRPFLDALYRPADAFLTPPDDTVVCRCEEVTAGDLRRFVDLGCLGPNQAKSFGRSGMGPCQGRLCGLTVSEIIAATRGVPVAEVGYYRIRPPIKPISLGDLASLAPTVKDAAE